MIIFYNIGNYYINFEFSEYPLGSFVIPKSDLNSFNDSSFQNRKRLSRKLNINVFKEYNYLVLRGERYIAFLPWPIYKIKMFIAKFRIEAEYEIQKFRANQKQNLLERITNKNCSLKKYLIYLNNYIFCDGFSLWSHNERTGIYVCEVSTFKKFETLGTEDIPTFNDALEKKEVLIEKNLDQSNEMYEHLVEQGMKSVIRFAIAINNRAEHNLIVSFYSKYENFSVSKNVIQMLKHLVKSRYFEFVQAEGEKSDALSISTLPDFSKGELDIYLCDYCKKVCEIFNYQDSAIFQVDPEQEIHTRATSSHQATDFIINGELRDNVLSSYNEGIQYCITSKIAQKDETDDSITHNLQFLPINVTGANFGVLVVRNKYRSTSDRKEFISPKSPHFYGVERAARILGQTIDMFNKYADISKKLDEQNNFNRVLMHEIRTPISKFTMAPAIIQKRIKDVPIEEAIKDKILLQLNDIQVLGGRLKFLTDSYQLDEMIRVNTLTKIRLIKDLILPVLNITKPYALKQYDCAITFDDKDMQSVFIAGDLNLMQMALNALLDNASKYSLPSSKSVKIYVSKRNRNYIDLSVSNIGYPIEQKEELSIFENGYRGNRVNGENIDGTGIGLFLVKEIMSVCNGDVILSCNNVMDKGRIVFTLRMPLYEDTK